MTLAGRILRIVLIALAVVVAVFLLLLAYLGITRQVWYPRQRARIEELRQLEAVSFDEDRFAVEPLDDSLSMNRLQMVATHNSYHLEPDWIRKTLAGLKIGDRVVVEAFHFEGNHLSVVEELRKED